MFVSKRVQSERSKEFFRDGLKVVVRYDDSCLNGHNTFSITGHDYNDNSMGCIHERILEVFPEFKEAVDFHLFSTDGALYYIDNGSYWLQKGNKENFMSTVIMGSLKDSNFSKLFEYDKEKLTKVLKRRESRLFKRFHALVTGFGFEY